MNNTINHSTAKDPLKILADSGRTPCSDSDITGKLQDAKHPTETDPFNKFVDSGTTLFSDDDLTKNPEDANNTEFVSPTVSQYSERLCDQINKRSQQTSGCAACLASMVMLGSMGTLYAFNSSVTPELFANTAQSSLVNMISSPIDINHKNLLSKPDYIDIVTKSIDQIEEL